MTINKLVRQINAMFDYNEPYKMRFNWHYKKEGYSLGAMYTFNSQHSSGSEWFDFLKKHGQKTVTYFSADLREDADLMCCSVITIYFCDD